MASVLNLMATARSVDNPQQLLLRQLIDTDKPAMRITTKQVMDFVGRVIGADAVLQADLLSLRKTPPSSNAVVNAVHWIYFATQHCHVFGWAREGEFSLEDNIPVCSFSRFNVPCPYVWFDQSVETWQVELVKHSLSHNEHDLRVAIETPEGTTRNVFTLERCMRIPTARPPLFTLTARDTGLSCVLDSMTAVTQFVSPFTMLLTFGKRFRQAVLFPQSGPPAVQPVFLHSLIF